MNGHYIIGLTGGIGSGKSAAAKMFEKYGIPVLDADAFSRRALERGTECYAKTVSLFGEECLNPDKSINRQYVAAQVFSDAELRIKLNAIVHPYVKNRLHSETENLSSRFVVWEVPLLFESGIDSDCDATVAILCRDRIRIKRIVERDNMSKEQAQARINAQITDQERKKRADYSIRNEGSLEQLEEKIVILIHMLEELYE